MRLMFSGLLRRTWKSTTIIQSIHTVYVKITLFIFVCIKRTGHRRVSYTLFSQAPLLCFLLRWLLSLYLRLSRFAIVSVDVISPFRRGLQLATFRPVRHPRAVSWRYWRSSKGSSGIYLKCRQKAAPFCISLFPASTSSFTVERPFLFLPFGTVDRSCVLYTL